jgi:hypothetical protein
MSPFVPGSTVEAIGNRLSFDFYDHFPDLSVLPFLSDNSLPLGRRTAWIVALP